LPVVDAGSWIRTMCKGDIVQLQSFRSRNYSWESNYGLDDPLFLIQLHFQRYDYYYDGDRNDIYGCFDTDHSYCWGFDCAIFDLEICEGESVEKLNPILYGDTVGITIYGRRAAGLMMQTVRNHRKIPLVDEIFYRGSEKMLLDVRMWIVWL